MKLYSWNVNGIRSVAGKGFSKWLEKSDADVVCVQEVKAFEGQVSPDVRSPAGYRSFWKSAKKPGYSGVATYTRVDPIEVYDGMGNPKFDDEGRVQALEYKNFVLINSYFPNSQREGVRLPYKLEFCAEMLKFTQKFVKKGKNVVLCGDYNIAHREIDLRNPKSNVKNAGFLPEERAWMDHFLSKGGFRDTFRHFEEGPHHYTWWSYRPGVREKNIGWRIDYFCANEDFIDRMKHATIHPEVRGSDHCPVSIHLKK